MLKAFANMTKKMWLKSQHIIFYDLTNLSGKVDFLAIGC